MSSSLASIAALALFALSPLAAAQDVALIHVRVDREDGKSIRFRAGDARFEIAAEVVDECGWPLRARVRRNEKRRRGIAWQCFEVPLQSEVSIVVFAPPHPLYEQVICLNSDERDKRVHVVLGASVPMVSLGVDVDLPPDSPSWSGGYSVSLLAPETGTILKYSTIREARKGLRLPLGAYRVTVHGELGGGCANGQPEPQAFVPASARVEATDGSRVSLRPVLGSRLVLNVVHPDLPERKSTMARLRSPRDSDRVVIGQRFDGSPADLVRAQLVSVSTRQSYDLTWGWQGLNYVFPWSSFPMGMQVEQNVPVPCGEYELILRGTGIAELRQRITLGPDPVTKLTLTPKQ